jgi:hypothetical protein
MSTLDELVRRIEREHYQPGNAAHFIYDPSTDSFRERIPWLWASQLHYYQVICSPTARPDATGTLGPIGVQDPVDGTMLRIDVGYEAWIAPENALQVVRSVAGNNPGERLTQLVIAAVQRRASTTAATFFKQFPDRSAEIARELEQEIFAEHGLSIMLTLRLVGNAFEEFQLSRLDIDVPVRLADYATELTVRLSVVVSANERDQARAIDTMKRRPYLKETLRTISREFFVDVELQRFRAELTGSLQQALRGRLEQALAQWYLQLKTFSIALRDPLPDVARFADEESEFKIELRSYPRPISLRARVQLDLTDEGRYHRAGAPPLKKWVEDNVQRIVQRVLFHVRYLQFHADLTKWEQLILKELQEAADAIGYAVKAQITTPELPERRFQNPFPLIVSEQFATSVSQEKTGLELVLRLQLPNLKAVEAELDRGADLEKLFHDVVLDEATAYLHTVSPGHLFTRFSQPVDHTGKPVPMPQADQDDRRPVTDELRERISAALKSRYGLTLLTFTVKQGPSALRDSYLALTQAISIPFQVNVPLLSNGEWALHYGELQVHGVAEEGWPRFQAVRPTREQVTHFVTAAAKDLFSAFLTRGGATGLTEAQARDLISVGLRERLQAELGLNIKVVAWYRDPTVREQALSQAQLKVMQEQFEADAQFLRKQRARALARMDELMEQERRLSLRGKFAEAEKVHQELDASRARFWGALGLSSAELLLPPMKENKKLNANNAHAATKTLPHATALPDPPPFMDEKATPHVIERFWRVFGDRTEQDARVFSLGMAEPSLLTDVRGERIPGLDGLAKSWVFFVDQTPDANWAHVCAYAVFDVTSEQATWVSAEWPPADELPLEEISRPVARSES